MRNSARLLLEEIKGLHEAMMKGNKAAVFPGGASADYASVIFRLSTLRQETIDDLMRADFKAESLREELIVKVRRVECEVINNLVAREGNTNGPLVTPVSFERLRGVVDQLDEKGVSETPIIDRAHMMIETEALIKDVQGWELKDHAKRTLLMQLGAIQRIIHAADTYSDHDLRLRVKGVIADFTAEFGRMDKEHQKMLEKLLGWGRAGFFTGVLVLGLTADASAVGLLPPPDKAAGCDESVTQ